LLVPCYKDIDPYDDLPSELSVLQGFDMGKVGFMHDLTHTVKKVLDRGKVTEKVSGENVVVSTVVVPGVESLMKRGHLFLEDSDWKQANEYFNKVLDIDPEHAPAYIGLLCAELKKKNASDLANHIDYLDNFPNYQKAIRFADKENRLIYEKYNQATIERKSPKKHRFEQKIQQANNWYAENLCWHCGGSIGMWSSACKSCGKTDKECFVCGGKAEYKPGERCCNNCKIRILFLNSKLEIEDL